RGPRAPHERRARRQRTVHRDRRPRRGDRTGNSSDRARRSRPHPSRPQTGVGTKPDVAEFCREIETYLCRKNDGHLIRVTGASFELVSGWAERGVPIKVAYAGIDRYFERYYRQGPRRRPVKIDFCEADVLDVFAERRRATGVTQSSVESLR